LGITVGQQDGGPESLLLTFNCDTASKSGND
jgi:hypothetical protein